ncbi:MAG: N-6 DNA methylase [Desulfobacteraceae bacterium]|nr:N-6 DNA methylase [Desulfobacteraceae bacterium]
MVKRTKKATQPKTTAERLGSVIKSCRQIMRKDKGLSGDLDRLPLLTWVMFLKFLDDLEQIEASRAKMRGTKYRPTIEPPYRWRDWAAQDNGVTGPELIAFINQEEAVRPDGTKGPGLFAYLSGLHNGPTSRKRVIASVFSRLTNRIQSGYILRDVINQVDAIHFEAQDELFTLGHLYESMLREMRDAAGDSGEFYTPRPVVRFMVEALDPRLGETILDPACGTGGFLVETFNHLGKQVKTVEDRRVLQEQSIYGGEAKPLPYLLCQMNLLLHGLEAPQIDPENSLRFPLNEIGDRDRVDVILTNPPFGGEEERGILNNFPEDKQTAETALLFLQLIMRKLKRAPNPGRAGVVVPNGTLSAPGVAARIRSELIREFRILAIVRLPHNVFAPYTDIRTNLLFFDRSGPTETIVYCEPPLPFGYNLSKTKPLRYEIVEPFLDVVRLGKIGEHCWTVKVDDLDGSLNFDLKNPQMNLGEIASADATLQGLAEKCTHLANEAREVRSQLMELAAALHESPIRILGDLTEECDERIGEAYSEEVRLLGVSNIDGFCDPKGNIGKHPEKYKIVREGYLAYNPMRINIGSIGVAVDEADVGITSPDYVVFRCNGAVLPEYVYHFLRSEAGRHEINLKTKGSVRFRLYYKQLSEIPIPVPDDPYISHFFDLSLAINPAFCL